MLSAASTKGEPMWSDNPPHVYRFNSLCRYPNIDKSFRPTYYSNPHECCVLKCIFAVQVYQFLHDHQTRDFYSSPLQENFQHHTVPYAPALKSHPLVLHLHNIPPHTPATCTHGREIAHHTKIHTNPLPYRPSKSPLPFTIHPPNRPIPSAFAPCTFFPHTYM